MPNKTVTGSLQSMIKKLNLEQAKKMLRQLEQEKKRRKSKRKSK